MKLIITEKPSVGRIIADVVGADEKGKGYIKGGGYIISWCFGHLVTCVPPEKYDETYKKWCYENLPVIPDRWKYEIKWDCRNQFNLLKDLMNRGDVTELICATDSGREGELIFRSVYMKAGCKKPFYRLWTSSMEESALKKALENVKPGHDYDSLYKAALCRQKADWLVGMNGTRLFTVLYNGGVKKVGRVQSPTLSMIVDREEEIRTFKKKPVYTIHLKSGELDAVSEKIKTKEEAEMMLKNITGMPALVIEKTTESKTKNPPKLYDLTSLQRDANRFFSFTAKQTLDYTQSLYEKKLVTYPRTDSRYLTDDMGPTAESVIEISKHNCLVGDLDMDNPDIDRILDSKKVSDHHALIPTEGLDNMVLESLPDGEKKIFMMIMIRLLSATSEPCEYELTKVTVSAGGYDFTASSKYITKEGYLNAESIMRGYVKLGNAVKYAKNMDKKVETEDFFDLDEEEEKTSFADLSGFAEGQELEDAAYSLKEDFTKPPAHFTESSLLAAMEKAGAEDTEKDAERKGLGTSATRAEIIEKLVKDGYVKRDKKNLIPTDEGVKLVTILPDSLKSPKMTSDWENRLYKISKGEADADEFVSDIEKSVRDLIVTYRSVRN